MPPRNRDTPEESKWKRRLIRQWGRRRNRKVGLRKQENDIIVALGHLKDWMCDNVTQTQTVEPVRQTACCRTPAEEVRLRPAL
jgi:hypothetical protein